MPPYAEPALVREHLDDSDAVDHDSAMGASLSTMLTAYPLYGRAVFVGHAFVQGGTGSDSERPLSVGGAGTVSASHFAPFCYAALGHLHRPQEMAEGRVRYAGALLRYSFDEVGQDRSVTIVDIDASGRCSVEAVVLSPRRDLRRIVGTLEELLNGGGVSVPGSGAGGDSTVPSKDDYIVARLTDPRPVLDPIGRLRGSIRTCCASSVRSPAPSPARSSLRGTGDSGARPVVHGSSSSEMTGQPPTEDEKDVFV